MAASEVTYALHTFASWPRFFTLKEVSEFIDLVVDGETLRSALIRDSRFVWLGPSAAYENYFIPERTLFRWFSHLSLRLAQAPIRLSERQLAKSLSLSLIRHGVQWDVLPPDVIKFGSSFGFCGPAWTADEYVFPLAHVLSRLSPPWFQVAATVLEGFAESENRGTALNQSLEYWLENGFSKFQPRVVEVVRAREGLSANVRMTLEQIGAMMNVTRERIRQIEAKFWNKIQEPPKPLGPPPLRRPRPPSKTIILPFVTGLLCDVMRSNGSLISERDSREAPFRRFIARCANVPFADLSHIGLIVLGHSQEDVSTSGSTRNAGEAEEDLIASDLGSANGVCLVNSDVKVIAARVTQLRRQRLTRIERVYLALCEIGRPAHYSEVTEVHNSLFPDHPASERNIHAVLSVQQHGIVWLGVRGTFALQEWGYERPSIGLFDAVTEIVEKIYASTGKPVPFNVIVAEMGKYRRLVKAQSLTIAAHCNPRLRRVFGDFFVPKMLDDHDQDEIDADGLDQILRDFESNQSR